MMFSFLLPQSDTENCSPTESAPIVISLEEMFGFQSEEMQTPAEIPSKEKPDPTIYPITTRIVIEGQIVTINTPDGPIETMWWSRTLEGVREDIALAEELYKPIGIKFVVVEVSFREFRPNVMAHFFDAYIHPGGLTVTYMLPKDFQWEGYSSAPWEEKTRGIVIGYKADKWTLAHELGHYFGLLHPFSEDLVDDTPPQEQQFCTGPEFVTPNCHNIMNYCDHEPKSITPGQLDRFKRFFRAKRIDHFDEERTDLLLPGQDFIVPK